MVLRAPVNEADILSRVIRPRRGDLSAEAARGFLRLGFSEKDRERMSKLARKNREGRLTSAEGLTLESYCRVGRLLDLLHSKARLSLTRSENRLPHEPGS